MDWITETIVTLILLTGCSSGQVLPPGPLAGEVGGNITFTTIINSKLLTVSWIFNNGSGPVIVIGSGPGGSTPGSGYEGRVSLNRVTGSLELRQLTLRDSGLYSVTLTSDTGATQTGQTTLNVYEKISGANITGPTEVLIAGNSSANLSCQATAGTIISRKWLKDGHPLSPSNRITLSEDNSSVSIDPLQGIDNGQYQCRLTNPVSNDSVSYDLTVNFGPEKVVIKGEAAPEVDSKLELICSAESVPPASFSWLVNGTDRAANGSLVIENVSMKDAGKYTCVARNDVTGLESSTGLTLTVTVPESSHSLSGGAIAGIVIGTIGAAGLIGGGGFFAYKKWFQ